MFAMFEGSDNNYDLTDMRVPFTWNEPDCSENITYKGGDYEGFFYNGKQCLDFDAGSSQSDDQATPIEEVIKVLQGAWNFLYLHSPMITYYKGTFNAFQTSDYAQDVYKKYIHAQMARWSPIDQKVLFITSAGCSKETKDMILEEVQKYKKFDQIYMQEASAAIPSNCGAGCVGLIYMLQ